MGFYWIRKRVFQYSSAQVKYAVQSNAASRRHVTSKCEWLLMPYKVGYFQRWRYLHSSTLLSSIASQLIATVPVGHKISRAAKVEAQAVLLDYFQNTRNLQFVDADHISRNSDRFLLDLLAKLGIEENVTKSLSKYLQFHPINEFEPFFESLGLTPAEYSAYLPRDLIYLSDNQVLLDNFHELSNYGIPPGKMGKIYAEAECVFRYDYGVLASKLRAYEEFGLKSSSLARFVTCDPSLLVGDVNNKFINFLHKLNKLGLESEWFARHLSSESSYNWVRMSETLEILDGLGCSEDNVAMLFRNEPGLLLENSGMAIYIFVGHLIKLGFKRDEVTSLFLQDPELMSMKRLKNLSHSMAFLFEIRMKLDDIAHVVRTHKHILSSNTPKRPQTVLGTVKVGESALRKIVKKDPTLLFVSSSTSCSEAYKDFSFSLQAPTRCLKKTSFLISLGYVENSEEFLKASNRFQGRGDQLQERFNCLVQAGLDSSAVAVIVKKAPRILVQGKEVLEQKLHVLTNVVGYPLESLVSCPTILYYDVRRISLRLSMYSWLRDQGVVKPDMGLRRILGGPDERFVKDFVDIHEHAPAAWEKLKKSWETTQALSRVPVGDKISSAAKAEAQAVLFDYLRNTRFLEFADADHISKNSNQFLLDLLAKVDSEENVTEALSSYLRFNPINEFEPFFESLGLTPAEYSAYVPEDLMYLSDNKVLLNNFHYLCDYGIPRGKIGKIYAQAECIFRYDYGVLASKFRAYEELGLGKSSLIKFVMCDPSLLVGSLNTKLINVLQKLNNLGLESEWLAGYVSAESSYNWTRMSEILELLAGYGCGEDNLAMLFRNEPGLLLENSGMGIHIFVGNLIKLGFKKEEVIGLFLQDPKLMSKKCLENLSHSTTFLFEIGMTLEDIAYVVQTHIHILSSNMPFRPASVLRSLRVGVSALRKIVKKNPTVLFTKPSTSDMENYKAFSFSVQAPTRCLEKTRFLKSLGYVENSEEFFQAAKKFQGRGDQFQERFNCLVQAGLDSYKVAEMIKRAPKILNQSKETLEQKMHLLTNVIGYPIEFLVSSASYLKYDVKRISLRCSMYLWLRDRGLAKRDVALTTVLSLPDEQFVKRFVDIHEDGHAAWEKIKESWQATHTQI